MKGARASTLRKGFLAPRGATSPPGPACSRPPPSRLGVQDLAVA